jgi:hypothetical protein
LIKEIALGFEESSLPGAFEKENDVFQILSLIAEIFDGHNKTRLEQKKQPGSGVYQNLRSHVGISASADN